MKQRLVEQELHRERENSHLWVACSHTGAKETLVL